MPRFMDMMWEDPLARQSGLTALADATRNPYANPILEFALASRGGYEQSQSLEAERRAKEAALERQRADDDRRRRAEEQKQQLLELELAQMWKDPSQRDAIRSIFGSEVVAPLEKLSYGLDTAADELEWERVGELNRAEDVKQSQLQALLGGAAAGAGDFQSQVAALAAAGDFTGAANLVEARAKGGLRPAGGSTSTIRSGSSPLLRVNPTTGEVETIYTPPEDPRDAERERQKAIDKELALLVRLEAGEINPRRRRGLEALRQEAESTVGSRGGGGVAAGDSAPLGGLLSQVIATAAEAGTLLTRESIEAKAREKGVSFEELLMALAVELGVAGG